jgi:NTE family protein
MRIGQAMRIFLHSMDITARMLTEMRLEVDKPDVIIRPDVDKYGMLDQVVPAELVDAGRRAADRAVPSVRRALSWRRTIARVWRSPRAPKGSQLPCDEDSHPIPEPPTGEVE